MTRRKAWSEVEVSTYLDGALDAPTRQVFDAAITQDDGLRRRVDELREVVALVRAAPLREPPRNYLLTPAMVAETPPKRAVQRRTPLLLMQLATSLTAAAFVVTAGLSFLSRGVSPAMVTQDSAEFGAQVAVTVEVEKVVEVPVIEATSEEKTAETAASPQEEMEFAPLEAPAAPAEGIGGGATAPELAPMVGESVPPAMDAEKAAGDAGGEASPEELRVMALSESVTETVASGDGVSPADAPMPATSESMAETSTTMAQPLAYADDRAGDEVQRKTNVLLPWLPGVLGVVTLILAGGTLWMSRRR
jgi:anti-sigma factor RsiW